ncbi:hypothetical protein [Candidatus Mycoplasma mahonii]|uniref:hypothetical protein n=1 Tax=Candidatus Mycoplasma mahonii TaxID=3004105 RepID=UPI0026F12CFF|nr:hypothetical protein [Candidatus Mycoplasma mahonii]WKX02799.1 hypothetical protein O3I44_01870 [Candidatus Mycoplasma mahonii]
MIKKYSFMRLLLTEIKFSLTPIKILSLCIGGLVMSILFSSYIPLFINEKTTTLALYMFAVRGTSVFIFSRTATAIQDKATIDKNKAVFLYYKKNWVTLSKLIVEVIIFIIGMLILFAIATISPIAHGNYINYVDYFINMLKILPGFIVTYIFVFSCCKWVISFISKQSLAYAASIFLTLLILSPILILNFIPQASILHFASEDGALSDNVFSNNQFIIAFIPLLNLGLITGVGVHVSDFSAIDHDWYVVIPILYSVLFTSISWTMQSSAQKRYLVAT